MNTDAAEVLRIPGTVLDDSAWDALAVVTDEDVEQIPKTWARVVPDHYKKLIAAEDDKRAVNINKPISL